MRNQTEILDELKQLCAQYKDEVPGHRRAWPKSIKERVAELQGTGLGDTEIGRLTSISSQTIYSWRAKLKQPRECFLPVKVVEASTVTVKKKRKYQKQKTSTVTIVTPGGYRIEGLNEDLLIDFFMNLEGRK